MLSAECELGEPAAAGGVRSLTPLPGVEGACEAGLVGVLKGLAARDDEVGVLGRREAEDEEALGGL